MSKRTKVTKEVFDLKGTIKYKSKDLIRFADDDQDEFEVPYDNAYKDIWEHIMVDDTIVCYIYEDKDSNDNTILKFNTKPFITRDVSIERNTMQMLIRCSRVKSKANTNTISGNTLTLSISQLYALYRHIEKEHLNQQLAGGIFRTVDEFLSYKANQCEKYDRESAAESILVGYTGKVIIPIDGLIKVLLRWHYSNDLRLLKLLGLTKDEIDLSYMSLTQLYAKLLANPMLVHSLDTKKAKEISKLVRYKYTKLDITCSKALNKLVKLTTGGCNTYVDSLKFISYNKYDNDVYIKLQDHACKVVGGRLYLNELYDMERTVATRFASLMKSTNITARDLSALDKEDNSGGRNYTPDQEQKAAVTAALNKNIVCIIGAAGTGKTTIIKNIVKILTDNDIDFACTSFTGKATARIEECCDISAVNMDMMIVTRKKKFTHLIIDECSMLNLDLLYRFFCAFPHNFRLTLVGDPNQLEPIGFGSVFTELLKSETVHIHKLEKIYRVKTPSGLKDSIIENANRISFWGDLPFTFNTGDNFVIKEGGLQMLINEIKQFHRAGMYGLNDFVVISPYTRDLSAINAAVQYIYNRHQKCVVKLSNGAWKILKQTNDESKLNDRLKTSASWKACYYVNDLVMCKKNNIRLGVYNGQEGTVIDVSSIGITVRFKDKEILFPFEASTTGKGADISYIELFNATTVHKMQGSQRKCVIIYYTKDERDNANFITKNMMYTAPTRAEEMVLFIVESEEDLCKTITNFGKPKNETLCVWLKELLPQIVKEKEEDKMLAEYRERQEQALQEIEDEYGINLDDY